jgi:hypothetical protein
MFSGRTMNPNSLPDRQTAMRRESNVTSTSATKQVKPRFGPSLQVVALGMALSITVFESALGDARDDGMALAADLRSSAPPEAMDVRGLIRMRAPDGQRTVVPFTYRIDWISDGWISVYETAGGGGAVAQRLTVVHRPGERNEYRLEKTPLGDGASVTTTLRGVEAMVPFAGSDFWLADLGMEYLHWPEHHIVENLKIKMRKGRPCRVLESVNPDATARGYTRVRSWVDRETGKPIIAEAYGSDGQLLKEFEVGGVTKVNGVWELKNLEMRDVERDSRTLLEFSYQQKD